MVPAPVITSAAARWNRRVLRWFGPVLLAAGALGFLLPASLSFTSVAPAYNLFHLAAGVTAVLVTRSGSATGAAVFNFGFGLIDLWQAAAGVLGLFPAALFALGLGDHLVHVLIGTALTVLGWKGLRAR